MAKRSAEPDRKALALFQERSILSIDELSLTLGCAPITARRRLKEWNALTSYNKNGRYYTLPSIARFNKKGLWSYQGVRFSKHGTFKATLIHFVTHSPKGLTNSELAELLGINPNAFLPHFPQIPQVRKERYGRQVVYYASEEHTYRRQKRKRLPAPLPPERLPPDAQRILILVEKIRTPRASPEELARILARGGHPIDEQTVVRLLAHYGLVKKNVSDTSP
jgi:hypothetical protein